MKLIKKTTALFIALVIIFTLCFAAFDVSAAAKSYSVLDLVKSGKAKAFGRYEEKDGKMSAYWGGNGIELNVDSNGGEMHLTVSTNDKIFMAAFVDGELQEREPAVSTTHPDFYVNVPKGKHNVRILRDTQVSTEAYKYATFDTLELDGKILDKPKDKDLYIEVIGDSIAAGCGAMGHYQKGVAWTDPDDHSIVKGFAYKLAARMDADYSIIARGGIGLYKDNSGSQESTSTALRTTMQDIYDFTNGYADLEEGTNKYAFSRKPDLIIFELSGNDNTKNEEQWRTEVVNFINHVRELNGEDVPIVWSGKNMMHAASINTIIKDGRLKNFYSCQYEYGGSGSAALTTQTAGHPDSGEQTKIMENLVDFMKTNGVIEIKDEAPENEKTEEKDEDTKEDTFAFLKDKNFLIVGGIGVVALILIIVVIIAAVKSSKKKKPEDEKAAEKTEDETKE